MNTDIAASSQNYFLILTANSNTQSMPSSLLQAVKRLRYQGPNPPWHVAIVLPSLLSYAYADSEKYHADWHSAMVCCNVVSQQLGVSSGQISILHGSPRKLLRQYKRKYPDMIFPVNRTVLEKNLLIGRWYWRKAKRKIREGHECLKDSITLRNDFKKGQTISLLDFYKF